MVDTVGCDGPPFSRIQGLDFTRFSFWIPPFDSIFNLNIFHRAYNRHICQRSIKKQRWILRKNILVIFRDKMRAFLL
jgi:hypothetical protein